MSKPVRLIDVAQATNTSIKTVSRVLNGHPRVSDETRARVQEKMNELGYQVDVIARSLRTGVDNVIGLVVPKIGDPFFAELVEEIEEEANRRGVGVIVGSTHWELDRENDLVQGFKQRRVAGMIITPQDADYSFMKDTSTPVVFVDRSPRNIKGEVIRVDDKHGAEMATDHLIKHGHKKIAFIGDKLRIKTSKLRFDGFKASMAAAGIPINDDYIINNAENAELAEPFFEELMNLKNPPTAIFCAKSEISIGIVRAMHRTKRTDIAFFSFDDFTMADSLQPAITILDHSPRALGRAAVKRLLERMDGGEAKIGETNLPLKIIERGSGEIKVPSGKARA
ncbi:MAG: LacI family DNA-binding transcriptional regulator [Actinomycetes bacterium]